MKQKKNKVKIKTSSNNKSKKMVVILIISVIVLILLIGIAYAYFATDLFKSNKQLFFKYITQIGDSENGFIENNLKQYFEKRKNSPYEDQGDFNVNITSQNGQGNFDNANNMNISFSGKVDTPNSKSMQNVEIKYSDEVKFPVSYKQVNQTIGLQTQFVGSKYVAIRNENLNQLQEDLDIDKSLASLSKSITNIQETGAIQLTSQDLENIKNTYLNILNQELQEENFGKIEESNSTGYKLTLNGEQLKNVLVKLLETLKTDQTTLNKINEYIKTQKNSSKITVSNIDELINNLNNNSQINSEKFEMTVYKNKGKTNKIEISLNEIKFYIEKTVNTNELKYNISSEIYSNNEIVKIYLNIQYEGLQSIKNISENYELGIEQSGTIQYKYNFNNNINFIDQVDIEDFTSENSIILNDQDTETAKNLVTAIEERIIQVNKEQMEKLGLIESENPLQYIIPNISANIPGISNIQNSRINVNEETVNEFNQKFELYSSTNLQGVTVKGLLSTIQLNNETQEDDDMKIKEIHYNGEEYEVTDQNITFIKGDINTEERYRIEFEKDEDSGIIYRAVINKK